MYTFLEVSIILQAYLTPKRDLRVETFPLAYACVSVIFIQHERKYISG